MPLPAFTTLTTMDVAFQGTPFVNGLIKTTVYLPTLDVAYRGAPFFSNEYPLIGTLAPTISMPTMEAAGIAYHGGVLSVGGGGDTPFLKDGGLDLRKWTDGAQSGGTGPGQLAGIAFHAGVGASALLSVPTLDAVIEVFHDGVLSATIVITYEAEGVAFHSGYEIDSMPVITMAAIGRVLSPSPGKRVVGWNKGRDCESRLPGREVSLV